MGILSLMFLVVATSTGLGDVLNDLWIETNNTGNIDSYGSNIYEFNTRLSDYQINLFKNSFLRFRVKACRNAFILLSLAYDLNSTDFYEIDMGGSSNTLTYFRRKSYTPNVLIMNTSNILSCSAFNSFTISWSSGNIVLESTLPTSQIIINWTDPVPIAISGIGIRTGFGSNATWIIEHEAMYIGYYCGLSGGYGSMLFIQISKTSSVIECIMLCSSTDQCLGVNFNLITNECQLIAGGQVVTKVTLGGWLFYTKCLNKMKMCLGCLN